MSNKLVSIIITTYRGSSQISRALNSVFLQTYPNIELIVVDDNEPYSDERYKTEKIISQYIQKHNLIYIRHKQHCNGSVARNTGLVHASGYYISFLDDDDFYLPEKTAHCVKALEKSSSCDSVLCQVIKCNEKGRYIRYSTYSNIKNNAQKNILMNNNFLGSGSNLFLTQQSIKELNGFDEGFIRYQDVEFMLRFFRKYQTTFLNELQVVKAVNGTSNIPPLKLYLKTLNQLIAVFEKDICSLNEYEKRIFYYKHYEEILKICNYSGDFVTINRTLDILKAYNSRLYLEYLNFALSRIKIFNLSLYTIIGNLVDRIKNSYKNYCICKNPLVKKEHPYIQFFLQHGGEDNV